MSRRPPSTVTVAETARLWAPMATPAGTVARLITFASVIATAAPIVASAPCDADPSAEDAASVFALDASVTGAARVDHDPGRQQRLGAHGGEGDRDGGGGVDLAGG